MVSSIIIENDGEYKEAEFVPARLEDLSREEILDRIREGGVVGMGGAGFPTQVKLSPKDPDKIEYIQGDYEAIILRRHLRRSNVSGSCAIIK